MFFYSHLSKAAAPRRCLMMSLVRSKVGPKKIVQLEMIVNIFFLLQLDGDKDKRNMLTNGNKSMLQLQSEGHQRHLFGHGQNGNSRQVGYRITRIPLAGWGLKTQTVN